MCPTAARPCCHSLAKTCLFLQNACDDPPNRVNAPHDRSAARRPPLHRRPCRSLRHRLDPDPRPDDDPRARPQRPRFRDFAPARRTGGAGRKACDDGDAGLRLRRRGIAADHRRRADGQPDHPRQPGGALLQLRARTRSRGDRRTRRRDEGGAGRRRCPRPHRHHRCRGRRCRRTPDPPARSPGLATLAQGPTRSRTSLLAARRAPRHRDPCGSAGPTAMSRASPAR